MMQKKLRNLNTIYLKCFILFLLLFVFISHAHASVEPINGFMDKIYNKIASSSDSRINQFSTIALGLLTGFSVIEIGFDTGTRILKESGATKLIAFIIVRAVSLMILAALIKDPNYWIKPIIDFAYTTGSSAGGIDKSITPSSIAGMGVDLFNSIMVKVKETNFSLVDPRQILYGLIIIVVGLSVILLFTLIGLLFLVTKIESTLVISVGCLMLGFLGSSWTSHWGKSYFSFILAVFVKLVVMLIMIGITKDITSSWGNQIADAGTDFDKLLDTLIFVCLCSIVLLWIVMNIPAMAASIVSGQSTAGLGSLLAAGTAGAAAGAALVSGAASLVNGAKSSIESQTGSLKDIGSTNSGETSTNESEMGPSGGEPPTPDQGGGISSGNDGNGNTNSQNTPQSSSDNGVNTAANKLSSANRNLQSSEGATTVSPPQAGTKNIDI